MQNSFSENSGWVILSPIEERIKRKIEAAGTPLKDWDVSIYRGILTGYNDAFIIDQQTRDRLVQASAKNAEIIRPLIRGRDISKYNVEWKNLFIIGTFPSLKINIDEYPDIKNHLASFGQTRLEQNGVPGSRKKTSNKWHETQDSISYWEDFSKPKIVWGEISDKSKFAYLNDEMFIEATSFLMTGNNLKFLIGMLNSKLLEWYFNQIGTATGVGTNRWKKYTIEQLPVYLPEAKEMDHFEQLVIKIIENPTINLIKEIDVYVYKMYGLNELEIEFFNP